MIHKNRIPSDMIGMDVSDQHVVHLFRSDARGEEPVEIRRVQVVEELYWARLAVADSSVDEDCGIMSAYDPGVHAGVDALSHVGRMARRKLLFVAYHHVRLPIREKAIWRGKFDSRFRHARDDNVAYSVDPLSIDHTTIPF